jgi:hypothetical protein
MVRCEATKMFRNEILDKMFMNIDADMGIRRIVGQKNKEQYQEIGINMAE